MRKPLVMGNWKLNGSLESNKKLISGINVPQGVDVVVCPPMAYLAQVAELVHNKTVELGVQNCAAQEAGALTGEVSASMINEFGAVFAIIGHSERRAIFKEDDELIAKRFIAAAEQNVVPILCVGETLEQRQKGHAETVIVQQLNAVFEVARLSHWEKAMIAYEPVWAIGTGETATPQQAQEMHHTIRQTITQSVSAEIGAKIRILYGGSVKPSNAAEIFKQPDIDGGLIGGASLDANDFNAIAQAAAK